MENYDIKKLQDIITEIDKISRKVTKFNKNENLIKLENAVYYLEKANKEILNAL